MNVLDLAMNHGLSPKKISNSKGGEFAGACPFCGGDDRFRIWPEQNNGSGSYWCRQCNATGDRIQFVMQTKKIGFKAACRITGDESVSDQYKSESNVPARLRIPVKSIPAFAPKESTPATALDNADIWMEKAWKLTQWAAEKLPSSPGQALLQQKGITLETAKSLKLGWLPEDIYRPRESWGLATVIKPETGKPKRMWLPTGLVIPNLSGPASVNRLRIRRPEGEPRYYIVPGSSPSQMILGAKSCRSVVIVESELDAILLHQCAGDITSIIAMGTSHAKPDTRAAAAISQASCILIALDYDEAGKSGYAWWNKNYPKKTVRLPSPAGKDPSDVAQESKLGIQDLRTWIISGWPLGWRLDEPQAQITQKKEDTASQTINHPEKQAEHTLHASHITELHDLLKKNRNIKIIVTPNRLTIDAPIEWQRRHPSVLNRLSTLIFFDPSVFGYLHNHGANNINAQNLLEARS